MSVEALAWALNDAPTDRTTDAMVLVGLANHADPDGRNAFPAVARLAGYGRMSRRAVYDALKRLEGAGLIRRGDQRVAAAHIGRGDRRPVVYDLALELRRAQPVDNHGDGVQDTHPVGGTGCSSRTNGVQLTTSRGAGAAPEPSLTVIRTGPVASSTSTGQGQGPTPTRPTVVVYDPDEAEDRFLRLTGEA